MSCNHDKVTIQSRKIYRHIAVAGHRLTQKAGRRKKRSVLCGDGSGGSFLLHGNLRFHAIKTFRGDRPAPYKRALYKMLLDYFSHLDYTNVDSKILTEHAVSFVLHKSDRAQYVRQIYGSAICV